MQLLVPLRNCLEEGSLGISRMESADIRAQREYDCLKRARLSDRLKRESEDAEHLPKAKHTDIP